MSSLIVPPLQVLRQRLHCAVVREVKSLHVRGPSPRSSCRGGQRQEVQPHLRDLAGCPAYKSWPQTLSAKVLIPSARQERTLEGEQRL